MPWSAPSLCVAPGCLLRARFGQPRCDEHQAERTELLEQRDRERGSAASRGYDQAWRRVRAAVLGRQPLCVSCEQNDLVVPATEVDHIVSIDRAPARRLDQTNLQPLCKPCHSAKTAREDGSFGRARAGAAAAGVELGQPRASVDAPAWGAAASGAAGQGGAKVGRATPETDRKSVV